MAKWEPSPEAVEREIQVWRRLSGRRKATFRTPAAYDAARHVLRKRHEFAVRVAVSTLRRHGPQSIYAHSDVAERIVTELEQEDAH